MATKKAASTKKATAKKPAAAKTTVRTVSASAKPAAAKPAKSHTLLKTKGLPDSCSGRPFPYINRAQAAIKISAMISNHSP